MAIKKRIDIETMVRWAYCDELPKKTIGELTGWERGVFLGTKVDEGQREYGYPVAMGSPHPDALLLDHAVRSLPAVGVDWARSRKHLLGDLADWISDTDFRVAFMSASPAALVANFAVMGRRPDWRFDDIRVKGKRGKNGKPVVQFLEDGHLVDGLTLGRRYGEGARCPMYLDPDPSEIASARFEYHVWRQALAHLAATGLNYAEYIPTGPAAAAAPWIEDTEIRGRVLQAARQA